MAQLLPLHFNVTQRKIVCFLVAAFFLVLPVARVAYAGTLSCSVTTAAACTGTVIWRMSASTNAHAELPDQSTAAYANNVVCCTGVTGLGNLCSGTFATALKLSGATNAHVEQNTQVNYVNNACLSVPSGGSVSVGYQAANCFGFDTTLGSMTGVTNAHVGDGSAYTTKICATASGGSQSLTFSISDNSIGFGTLSASAARYATGDTAGSATEVEAHTITASTNASNGYSITINGNTLTANTQTITAIGSSNTSPSIGTEQFGLRATASGGNGSVVTPYAASGFAFDTAAFPDQIAFDPDGDNVSTTYSVRYLGNISANTEAESYGATLTYVITAGF